MPPVTMLSSLFLALAMSAQAADLDSFTENAIYHGDKVDPSDAIARSTLDLVLSADGTQGVPLSICSATLIKQEVAITAAHCVSLDETNMVFYVRLFGRKGKVKVAKTLVHPGYRVSTTDKGDVAINDLALLRLESPLPDAQSAPLPVANLSLAKDQMVLMAGFGRNGLEPSKEELLRDPEIRDLVESARRNPPKTKEEKEELSAQIMGILARRPLLTTPGLAYLSVLKGQAPFMTIFSTKGACGGDSGGPSYVVQNEGLMLLGVHSTSSNADCVNKKVSLANDMFVPAHLSWIRESMVKILE